MLVGVPGSGKKSLITAFESKIYHFPFSFSKKAFIDHHMLKGMICAKGWKRGDEIEKSIVCVEQFYGTPVMFYLSIVSGILHVRVYDDHNHFCTNR